jgi:hypothetical protein
MAKNRKFAPEDVVTPETPAATPAPIVRVRARSHLAEMVQGEMRRIAPGEEFQLTAARAAALGPLVEILA